MNDVSPARKLAPVSQPVSPAKFAHFVLRTGQLDPMVEWYRTLLNARIVFRDERLCFLSYDDEHHRLALINMPGAGVRDPHSTGTDHVTYSYNDLGELLSTYRRLKTAGITPNWPINHGVTDLDLLPRPRQQPGRAADRQFRDAEGARRLFPQPSV
jgi:catechol-2,3-dioxygenase